MKIIIHSLNELLQLAALVRGGTSTTRVGEIVNTIKVDAPDFDFDKLAAAVRGTMAVSADVAQVVGLTADPDGLPTDIAQPDSGWDDVATAIEEEGRQPTTDADGAPYNTDWHSDPAKINADGRWRARRKRDEDAYKAWLLEQVVEVAEATVAADAEPVATETHALPQDDAEMRTVEEQAQAAAFEPLPEAVLTVDLAALVEASQEAALDASDSHMDLIKACQQYIEAHGHPAYNALKAAVAPLEGSDNGKAIPQFTPGERRLMRACMANYPTT